MNRNYKEVKLDNNGRGMDRYYINPLMRVYQYEYALFQTVSDLFESVRCRSMCVDSLKLYFRELGHKSEEAETQKKEGLPEEEMGKKKTQEDILAEMMSLVDRDVIGNITFPMMHVCSAEVKTVVEEDGSHSFIFTDGIFGFRLHLDMPRKGHPRKIIVTDLYSGDTDDNREDMKSCDGCEAAVNRPENVTEKKVA